MSKNWNNISIKQYKQIQEIDSSESPLDFMLQLATIVHKLDENFLYDLPISDLNGYLSGLEFVFNQPQPVLENKFSINGEKFVLDANISGWSAGRYIDYMRVVEQMPDRFDLVMALLYLPDGKKYGEFDISKSASTFYENLPITYVIGASSFFLTLSKSLTAASLKSLKKRLKTEKDLTNKAEIQKQIDEVVGLFGI